MIIQQLLEAGEPVYDFDHEMASMHMNQRNVRDHLYNLGAGKALEQILNDPSMTVYRGLRGMSDNIIVQDTLASTRRSQNTQNFVTLLTEVLPSWTTIGMLPRSKIVACSSSAKKAGQYGQLFVALPTEAAVCTYVGSHDFWDSFEAVNHAFGGDNSIPAINEAIANFVEEHVYPTPKTANDLVALFRQIKADLDSNELPSNRINKEMQALLDMEPGQHDLLQILNNALDPSHMRTSSGELLNPSNFHGLGEEVAIGGKIVFFRAELFNQVFRGNV